MRRHRPIWWSLAITIIVGLVQIGRNVHAFCIKANVCTLLAQQLGDVLQEIVRNIVYLPLLQLVQKLISSAWIWVPSWWRREVR